MQMRKARILTNLFLPEFGRCGPIYQPIELSEIAIKSLTSRGIKLEYVSEPVVAPVVKSEPVPEVSVIPEVVVAEEVVPPVVDEVVLQESVAIKRRKKSS